MVGLKMMKIKNVVLCTLMIVWIAACSHPLGIIGEGDIVDLNGSGRGCTLEQYNAREKACTVNLVGDAYIVEYQGIPREGWVFDHWEGPCPSESVPPNCSFNVPYEAVWWTITNFPGVPMPATVAVFVPINNNCTPAIEGDNASNLQSVLDRGLDLVLCRGQTYSLHSYIEYRAPGQSVYTLGHPESEAEQAKLVWGTPESGNTIIASLNIPNVSLHHVTIDGRRRDFGFDDTPNPPYGGLIEMLGAEGIYVGFNHIRDPRYWTCLVVSDGCSNALIANNIIGPCGQAGGSWADGISYGCVNGEVAHNEITDATDGGIVIFGATGSKIHDNTVIANERILLGGIHMVDNHQLDFVGTEVYKNRIIAQSAPIWVGLPQGGPTWGLNCAGEPIDYVEGASVHHNKLEGDHFRFGYVLNGVRNWDFRDNSADGTFSGQASGCYGSVARPRAFACQLETVNNGVCPPSTDEITNPQNLDGVIFPTVVE